MQQRALQVVGRERVSCHQTVGISVIDQGLHCVSRVIVEGKRRSHDPDDLPMFFFIAKKVHQAVIVSRIGGLPASSLAEHKFIRKRVRFCLESCTVDINSLLAGFAPSKNNLVTFFEISVFDYLQMSVRADHNAGIHAALFR